MSTIDLRASAIDHPDRVVEYNLRGELDLLTAPLIDEWVSTALTHGAVKIILDLSGVTFIDSSGLQALVQADDVAWRSGTRVVLRGANERVERLLQLTSLHKRFTFG